MLLVVVCQHLHNVFRIRHPSVAGAQPFERWREWTEMGSRTLPYVIPFGKLCNFCLTTWLHAFCSLHLINFLLGSKTVKIERCTWPPVCTSILVGGSSEEEQLRWPRWTEWTYVTVGATTILQSVKKWGKECEKRICVEIVDKCVPVLVDHREKESERGPIYLAIDMSVVHHQWRVEKHWPMVRCSFFQDFSTPSCGIVRNAEINNRVRSSWGSFFW